MKRILAVPGAVLVSLGFLAGCAELGRVFGHPGLPGGGPGGGSGGCQASNGVCKVDIGVPSGCTTGSCVTISPDPVSVGDGSGKVRNVNLLWKLPHGYAFCAPDDGIVFKGATYEQFSDNYATDDPEGARGTSAHGPNYHWKDANTRKAPTSAGFPYTLRFHDKATCTKLFEKDPGVVNEM